MERSTVFHHQVQIFYYISFKGSLPSFGCLNFSFYRRLYKFPHVSVFWYHFWTFIFRYVFIVQTFLSVSLLSSLLRSVFIFVKGVCGLQGVPLICLIFRFFRVQFNRDFFLLPLWTQQTYYFHYKYFIELFVLSSSLDSTTSHGCFLIPSLNNLC